MAHPALPEGFTLDVPSPNLPPGFRLDEPEEQKLNFAQRMGEDLKGRVQIYNEIQQAQESDENLMSRPRLSASHRLHGA